MGELSIFRFRGTRPGPHILILGAVHGDEPCGTIGLAQLKLELDTGLLALEQGQLTIVPIANPEAYLLKQRFVEANLNRIIGPRDQPRHQEDRHAATLMALIREADTLLDLHSYSAGLLPFSFLDYPTQANRKLVSVQGIPHCVTGWPELYADQAANLTEGDTVSYANSIGKSGILVECGRHDDPAAITVAYRCIRRTLAFFGMLPYGDMPKAITESSVITRVLSVIARTRPGRFTKPWQHLDSIHAGDRLIEYEDGGCELSPLDGYVILPNSGAVDGGEWLYLGQSESIEPGRADHNRSRSIGTNGTSAGGIG